MVTTLYVNEFPARRATLQHCRCIVRSSAGATGTFCTETFYKEGLILPPPPARPVDVGGKGHLSLGVSAKNAWVKPMVVVRDRARTCFSFKQIQRQAALDV